MYKRIRICFLLATSAAIILCACGQPATGPAGAAPTAPPVPTGTPKLSYNADILPQIPEEADRPISPLNQSFIVAVSGAELRSVPSSDPSKTLDRLTQGETVTCLEESGGYLKIQRETGEEGWCHSWFLDMEDTALDSKRDDQLLALMKKRETFIPLEDNPVYYCIASALNCRAEPSASSELLCRVSAGEPLTVCGIDGDFYLVQLAGGRYCYCSVNWLSLSSEFAVCPGGADLRVVVPTARCQLLYADDNNNAGKKLYAAIPILEETTAKKLLEASRRFWQDGYALIIYDAYRSETAQYELYSAVKDSRFIQDPAESLSLHQRGRAVDLSLLDLKTGEELEMPCAVNSFTAQAMRTNKALWSKTAETNVAYMTRVLKSAGFESSMLEWWHFEYTGEGGDLSPDLDLDTLQILPVTAYEAPD